MAGRAIEKVSDSKAIYTEKKLCQAVEKQAAASEETLKNVFTGVQWIADICITCKHEP